MIVRRFMLQILCVGALGACGSTTGSHATSGMSGSANVADSSDEVGGSASVAGSSDQAGGAGSAAQHEGAGQGGMSDTSHAGDSHSAGAMSSAGATSGSVAQTCMAGVAGIVAPAAHYDVVNVTTGSNGTFTDKCDTDGNLIEYVCGFFPPTPQESGRFTGEVVPNMIDCGGKCQDGACYVSKNCPKADDVVTWVSASAESVVIDNARAPVRYTCKLRTAPYGFACTSPSLAGQTGKVNSVGPCGTVTDLSVDADSNGAGTTDCAYVCTEELR